MGIIKDMKESYREITQEGIRAKIDEVLKTEITEDYIGDTMQNSIYDRFVTPADDLVKNVVLELKSQVIRSVGLTDKLNKKDDTYLEHTLYDRVWDVKKSGKSGVEFTSVFPTA